MQFTPLDARAREEAIGPIKDLPSAVQRLLDPHRFLPMGKPGPFDWLTVHPESGQTYAQFLHSRPNFPDQMHRIIYFLPLEEFSSAKPSLHQLKTFTEAYFSMPVRILPVLAPQKAKFTTRINAETRKPQILTSDVLKVLQQQLPRDGYCMLGITLQDLYPDPKWNFVFGEASLNERVGIYSFLRYDPRFSGEERPDRDLLILRRSCNVLAHETAHMFGIDHCIFFRCVMNGSNTLLETDASPLHLCPVDLHKLYTSIRFDPLARYAHLRDFFRDAGLKDQAAWLDKQLEYVTGK